MAANTNDPRRFRALDIAVWRKWNKFAVSGLLAILIGLVITGFGLLIVRTPYSPQSLVVGLGIIVLLVGIIRLLIGFISPAIPADLEPPGASLDEGVFAQQEPEDGHV